MKKIKEIKTSKTQKKSEVDTKQSNNLHTEKSTAWPEEYEEQRSMNIRMEEQPLRPSANTEQKKE